MNAVEDLGGKVSVFMTNVHTTTMVYNALYDPKFVAQLKDKEEAWVRRGWLVAMRARK
jgi:hypothetical protein